MLSNGHAGFGRGPAGNARWQHRNARPQAYLTNGSSHRGQAAIDRLAKRFPNAVMVHTPVHASWLNQVEIYFSIVQRKVLTPNDLYVFSSGQRAGSGGSQGPVVKRAVRTSRRSWPCLAAVDR